MDEDNITHEPLAMVMDGLPSHNPDSGTIKSLGIQSVDIDINVMEKKNNEEQNDCTNVVQYSETVQCEENGMINVASLLSSQATPTPDGNLRPIKHRPTFTEDQIATMESIFKQRQYLSPVERESVASVVGLTPQQVRVWFQNRRQKVKQFLTQKQMGNDTLITTPSSDEEKRGNSQIDLSSILTTQKLANQIDPQILQLLLPKYTINQNGDDSSVITLTTNDKNVSSQENSSGVITTESDSNENEQDNTTLSPKNDETSLGAVVTSNGSISLTNPQALLYLTPLLLPLNLQGGSSQTIQIPSSIQLTPGSSNSVNVQLSTPSTTKSGSPPTNAVQLLQTSHTSPAHTQNSHKLAQVQTPISRNNFPVSINLSSSITPLKAQSPTTIEEVHTSESNIGSGEVPVIAGLNSEVLQQLFGQSTDKVKTSWSVDITSKPNVLSSSLAGSIVSSADGPRKKRQVFSGHQIQEMEKHFNICPYIDTKEREKLAEKIGLHVDQVKVWFQNRRTKRSRMSWRQKGEQENQ